MKNNGDLRNVNVSDKIKEKYKTAFQLSYHELVECAALRQVWIDQAQSFNLYVSDEILNERGKISMKNLIAMYMKCFDEGLKTTYYLRSIEASSREKS